MELEKRARARKGLGIYLGTVVLRSGVIEFFLLTRGKKITETPLLVFLLMWTPAFASLVARLVLREGIRDISFALRGKHGWSAAAMGWLYVVPVAFLGYGLAWATALASFRAPATSAIGLEHAPAILRFGISFGLNLTLGTLVSAISAAGEEIGWRGYMLTRLVDADIKRPVLVSGIIWGVWHTPLIVNGQYASGPYPILSASLFILSIVPASYIAARVRMQSGSVWPAIIFHSSWNAVVQGTFDSFTQGGDSARTDSIWIGESGILVASASLVVALILLRRPWAYRRNPNDESTRMFSLRNA